MRVQADAFRISDGQLIYSAISRSENPEDLDDLISDVTSVITRDLDRREVISRQ